jgi:5'-3' exonuclease
MKYLLIDGNSVGYACHYATKLHSGDMETQAIFGFLKTMRELRVTYPEHVPLVLWDGRATWRFDLLPEYKSNRDDDPKKVAIKETYTRQTPYIKDALFTLGVRQIHATTHEADDLAGYFVPELLQKEGTEIVLITGDRDWLQLVRPGVTWRDMRDDSKVVTFANFFDKTAYKTPLAFLEGKCLQGDSSDCISGVGGIGEKGAPEFVAQFGSVRNFWAQCDSGAFKPTKKAHINLYSGEGRQIFGRNLKVMQLLKVPKPEKEHVSVRVGPLRQEAFNGLCQELAFASITRNLQAFTKPFEAPNVTN